MDRGSAMTVAKKTKGRTLRKDKSRIIDAQSSDYERETSDGLENRDEHEVNIRSFPSVRESTKVGE